MQEEQEEPLVQVEQPVGQLTHWGVPSTYWLDEHVHVFLHQPESWKVDRHVRQLGDENNSLHVEQ